MAPTLKLTAFVAVLLFIQSTTPTVADILSPLLSPILDDLCKEIECGKGKCKASLNYTPFGFICECESGWKQSFSDGQDHLGFLPCVIPNCTLNYSCSKAESPAPAIKEPQHNESVFDPCHWTYCGEGSCITMNKVGHRCECAEGHDNLLNVTAFPCFKECSLGMDCARLGIAVSNNSASSTTNSANSTDSDNNSASSIISRNFLWLTTLMIFLTMAPWK